MWENYTTATGAARTWRHHGKDGKMKYGNNMTALNDYLFEMMDAVSNEDLTGEALEEELKRTSTKLKVAEAIMANSRLALDVMVATNEYGLDGADHVPKLLAGE